jgi:TatD DNase family protein
VIDFHCHLDLYPDPASVVADCERRGTYVLAVTTTPLAWEGNQALVQGASRIRVAPGLHPELVSQRHTELPLLLDLVKRSRYVGEVGIDGGPNCQPHMDLQGAVFRDVLRECSRQGGRVLSIHSRGAATEVLNRIEADRGLGLPVLHWFSGSQAELARAIELGCWFSVGPAMVKSKKGQQLVSKMPRDRVLTETDAPFVQERGRPLMPWDADKAIHAIAAIWNLGADQSRAQIRSNLLALTCRANGFEIST